MKTLYDEAESFRGSDDYEIATDILSAFADRDDTALLVTPDPIRGGVYMHASAGLQEARPNLDFGPSGATNVCVILLG